MILPSGFAFGFTLSTIWNIFRRPTAGIARLRAHYYSIYYREEKPGLQASNVTFSGHYGKKQPGLHQTACFSM